MDKKKVLIIDDEHDIVEVIKKRFEASGYDVVCAYNGADGLKKAEGEKPDAVVLDIIMPQMHGFEVCKKLKDNPKTTKIPIVVITGAGLEDIAKNEPEMNNIEACVTKPFDAKELLGVVQNVIKKYAV